MTKYIKATLHANGETQDFATPTDAERLRAAFKANYFKSADGTTEYGVTLETSAFVVLEIDPEDTGLGPKPNCDNYGNDCPTCPPAPTKGGDVTVKYIDKSDNKEIATGLVISGNVGDSYNTEKKNVTGYTYDGISGSPQGTITDKAQTVTYIYTKDAEG